MEIHVSDILMAIDMATAPGPVGAPVATTAAASVKLGQEEKNLVGTDTVGLLYHVSGGKRGKKDKREFS